MWFFPSSIFITSILRIITMFNVLNNLWADFFYVYNLKYCYYIRFSICMVDLFIYYSFFLKKIAIFRPHFVSILLFACSCYSFLFLIVCFLSVLFLFAFVFRRLWLQKQTKHKTTCSHSNRCYKTIKSGNSLLQSTFLGIFLLLLSSSSWL